MTKGSSQKHVHVLPYCLAVVAAVCLISLCLSGVCARVLTLVLTCNIIVYCVLCTLVLT